MQKKIVDLTHKLSTGMPTYAGDKPNPEIISRPGKLFHDITISSIRLGSHCGTHIDAPRHFSPRGESLLDIPVNRFVGKALCLNKEDHFPGPIDLTEVEKTFVVREKPEWLLLYTGFDRNWGRKDYFLNHPYLSISFAEFILEMSISGVGGDFPSVDSANAQQFDFPIHRTLLGADRLIIENLCCLNKLPNDRAFDLCALPLKIDADGSPARVVAVL